MSRAISTSVMARLEIQQQSKGRPALAAQSVRPLPFPPPPRSRKPRGIRASPLTGAGGSGCCHTSSRRPPARQRRRSRCCCTRVRRCTGFCTSGVGPPTASARGALTSRVSAAATCPAVTGARRGLLGFLSSWLRVWPSRPGLLPGRRSPGCDDAWSASPSLPCSQVCKPPRRSPRRWWQWARPHRAPVADLL